jgi:nucleoside-diphosphate-sugar epimerase
VRVLVSGHNGNIGSVLTPMLTSAGFDVTGLDFLYEECTYGADRPGPPGPGLQRLPRIKERLSNARVDDDLRWLAIEPALSLEPGRPE